jgi:hypothetical protein
MRGQIVIGTTLNVAKTDEDFGPFAGYIRLFAWVAGLPDG